MCLSASKVSFEHVYYDFAEKLDKLFWIRLNEMTFEFPGIWLEILEGETILRVHRPRFLKTWVDRE